MATDPQVGDEVSSSFNPAFVAASYFASLVGCMLTVELLHRRGTGVRNWRSWVETVGCATCLGLVGVWCMHFIGNRAIILGDGSPQIQLVYGPRYSVLSAFLPIIGLSVAFATAEYPIGSNLLHKIALTCTGVFAGLSVVGMHYIGNFAISNYSLHYIPRFLAASMIIAIGDCAAVLVLFYTWRDKWISDWRQRQLCAVVLAGGISAMHFTASTHCVYVFKHRNDSYALEERNVQVAVAGAFCAASVAFNIGIQIWVRYRARVRKGESKKVMLACVIFGKGGRIMVTTEGMLPVREITDKYNHRTFNDDFDTAHPVFQWIFKVTRNWTGVIELIPKMKSHLGAHKGDKEADSSPVSSTSSAVYDPESYNNYEVIFRERFCTAAAALASSMHLPVERVGVLYDTIVETGTIQAGVRRGPWWKTWQKTKVPEASASEMEKGLRETLLGKGQVLILTRAMREEEETKMLNAGFKFATIQQVGHNIAENMQIPLAAFDTHISGLKRYVDSLTSLQKPGTWLSCFAMIPKPGNQGFDVAVKQDEQDQLPDVPLLDGEPSPWQLYFLERLHDKPAPYCITFLEDRHSRNIGPSEAERSFALTLLQSMNKLRQQIPIPWFDNARFYGKPQKAHYSRPLLDSSPVTTMFSIAVCTNMHTTIEACCSIKRVPLSFYSARQQCYQGSPNEAVFAREIHQEFGPLLARKGGHDNKHQTRRLTAHVRSLTAKKLSRGHARHRTTIYDEGEDHTDASSDTHELVDKPRQFTESIREIDVEAARNGYWGGIMVNSKTIVNRDSNTGHDGNNARNAGLDVGTKVAVGTLKYEDTWVDELTAFTRATIPSKIIV